MLCCNVFSVKHILSGPVAVAYGCNVEEMPTLQCVVNDRQGNMAVMTDRRTDGRTDRQMSTARAPFKSPPLYSTRLAMYILSIIRTTFHL